MRQTKSLTEAEIIKLIAGLNSSAANHLKADDIGYFTGASRTYAATDSLIAGVHFRHEWLSPAEVAWKLFARNWSDFLCKGIRPDAALLNLALTPDTAQQRFIAPFLRSLDRLFSANGITLIGGDTARSANDVFTLAFFGTRGKLLPRIGKNIQVGDLVVQLGGVGGSDYALRRLLQRAKIRAPERAYFAKPQIFPALPQSKFLKATIDQSDSVQKSLKLLAEANRANFRIELAEIAASHNRVLADLASPGQILTAAEDLAVFAIASPAILKGAKHSPRRNSSAAFRAVGKVESIRTRSPRVEYYLAGAAVKPPRDAFEHFT